MAYDQLLDRGMGHYVPVAGTGHDNSSPKARGSYVSKIRKHIETDVCAGPLPLEDRRRIYTWIDANVPFYGTYAGRKELKYRDEPDFRPSPRGNRGSGLTR